MILSCPCRSPENTGGWIYRYAHLLPPFSVLEAGCKICKWQPLLTEWLFIKCNRISWTVFVCFCCNTSPLSTIQASIICELAYPNFQRENLICLLCLESIVHDSSSLNRSLINSLETLAGIVPDKSAFTTWG